MECVRCMEQSCNRHEFEAIHFIGFLQNSSFGTNENPPKTPASAESFLGKEEKNHTK